MTSNHTFIRNVLLFLLLLLFIFAAYRTYRAYTLVERLSTQVQTLQQSAREQLSSDDLSASISFLRQELYQLNADWDELQDIVWPFDILAQRLTSLPEYGDDIAVTLQLQATIDSLLESIIILDGIFEPILSDLPGNFDRDHILEQGITQISKSSQALRLANNHSVLATESFESITFDPHTIHPQLLSLYQRLDQIMPPLELLTSSLQAAPTILGANEPHHILVLLQNADEIRPTGGWITSLAYVVIEDGQINDLSFQISNDPTIDRVDKADQYGPPPQPFIDYMRLPVWLLRDANWSPHFPTSAQKSAELYSLGREVPVDSVIAINQFSVQELLKITGPVLLNDGTLVNSQNFIQVAKESWELGSHNGSGQKAIASELGRKMLSAVSQIASPRELPRILPILMKIGREKDMFIYSSHENIQNLSEASGFSGSIATTEGDYLYIVDTNMSFDKSGVNIRKRFDYHVSLQDVTQPYGVLTLSYYNEAALGDDGCPRADIEWYDNYDIRSRSCFGNYIRVYVPDGSEPQALPYFKIPEDYVWITNQQPGQFVALPDEQQKEVFAGFMVLPPGHSSQGHLVYDLDSQSILSEADGGAIRYNLVMQKQSGIEPYNVSVAVDLPDNVDIFAVTPNPTAIQNSTVYFELLFSQDTHVAIEFQLP